MDSNFLQIYFTRFSPAQNNLNLGTLCCPLNLISCVCRYHNAEWNSKGVYNKAWDMECAEDYECEWAAKAKMWNKNDETRCCSDHCRTQSQCDALVVSITGSDFITILPSVRSQKTLAMIMVNHK